MVFSKYKNRRYKLFNNKIKKFAENNIMMNNSKLVEKILQYYRFNKAKPFLLGDVLDFGGNEGELKTLVKGRYLAVNYDHFVMVNAYFDTIVCLAVIEHMTVLEVYEIFYKFKNILNQGGRIILTTPTRIAKPMLELMALLGIIDKINLSEHKHYWNKKEIYTLAEKSGLIIKKYKKFQLGFNQLAILSIKTDL